MDEYEYGVWFIGVDEGQDSPHREGYTREQAESWIQEWEEMGGKKGIFKVIRRPLGAWEDA